MAGRGAARGGARRRVRAATGHALAFSTWQSLAREQGLDDAQAAELVRARGSRGLKSRPLVRARGRRGSYRGKYPLRPARPALASSRMRSALRSRPAVPRREASNVQPSREHRARHRARRSAGCQRGRSLVGGEGTLHHRRERRALEVQGPERTAYAVLGVSGSSCTVGVKWLQRLTHQHGYGVKGPVGWICIAESVVGECTLKNGGILEWTPKLKK